MAFSNGILVLAAVSIALVLAYKAKVDGLVALYAIGVFTGFTMAGAGMVKHHLTNKGAHWRRSAVVNGFSSFVSGVVVLIFAVAKFTEGAWLIVVVGPLLYVGLIRLHHQYAKEEELLETGAVKASEAPILRRHVVVVLVDRLDMATARALQYARTLTPDDLRARTWLKQLAQAEGLSIREDAVGNTFFRWTGSEPGLPAVATGSHIDAIPHAGMYDGTVGVLGGLEAIRALKRSGLRPRRSIELVLLTSEEPTRFGIGCVGSRLISGTLSPERADALHGAQRGSEDETLAQVRTAAGFTGPLSSVRLPNGHYHAWVELHIEQGPLLEREGIPLGIVTAIAAPASYRFTIEGIGGHAGALLMPDRRDALCAAAEIILSIEEHALATGVIDTVATVGTCDVYPGAVNSVPSRVTLQIDVRDIDPVRDARQRRPAGSLLAAYRRGARRSMPQLRHHPETYGRPRVS